MIDVKTSFQTRTYSIAAGNTLDIELDADTVLITELTGASTIEISVNNGPASTAFKGLEISGEIRRLRFRNTTAGSVTLEVLTAVGLVVRDRRVNPVGGTVPVSITSPATWDSAGEVSVPASTTTLVLASASNRRAAVLAAPGSNPREILVTDSAGSATDGIPLWPGERIELLTTSAVYCHNPHTGVQLVRKAVTVH